MNDKIRLLMPCEIPNLEKYVDIALIESELETYIKTLVPKINLQDLEDWNLLVNVLLQRTDAIGVAKRLARYPSDKEYAIYMSIPIPDDEQAAYGLSCVKEAYPKISNPKYSYDFLPEFSNYDDLDSYILESSRKLHERMGGVSTATHSKFFHLRNGGMLSEPFHHVHRVILGSDDCRMVVYRGHACAFVAVYPFLQTFHSPCRAVKHTV